MDRLTRLSRETQAALAASVLYLIFSFLDWQQVSLSFITVGRSEWHGVGVIAGLLVVALLLWEAVRLLEVRIELGSVTPGLISVGLALLLLLFTIITFLSHSTARHWPAWLGLLLSIVIAACAIVRARAEGVELPTMAAGAGGGAAATGTTTTAAEPAPPAPAEAPPESPGGTEPVG
ncbi:MAG TPA: hypothetical protein VFA19_04725 [Gaiellaceae bacterium]|nr:hypothetical protein [Gaiellaceae bacterium]